MSWEQIIAPGQVVGDLPHTSGRYYDSRINAQIGTFVVSTNILYGVPFLVPVTTTYSVIGLEVVANVAASSVELGIYNDSTGTPGSLVVDAGSVATTSNGGKTITINKQLIAGWYWLAGVFNGAITCRAISQTNALATLGFTSGTDTTFHVGWSVAQAFGALPNPFTGGGALTSSSMPRFMLGV